MGHHREDDMSKRDDIECSRSRSRMFKPWRVRMAKLAKERTNLGKSVSCIAAVCYFPPVCIFSSSAIFYEWHPGRPLLVFGSALVLLIVGGIWLYDEIREI